MLKRLANLFNAAQLSLFDAEPLSSPPSSPKAPQPVLPPALPPRVAPHDPAPAVPGAGSQRQVRLGEHQLAYELRRARRRSIGFTVSAEGLRVSAPRWVPLGEIERALQERADWILRKLVEQRERAQRLQSSRIEWRDGASLPFLGEPLTLRVDGRAARGAQLVEADAASGRPRTLLLGLPEGAGAEQIRDRAQAWLKQEARAYFLPRCEHFAQALGVQMRRLSLSSAQTRWGSASADGSIRLNWRLIHFAPATIDYVVAHELAHLREMNHSERFWAVVRSVLPDYEQARAHLRDESLASFEA